MVEYIKREAAKEMFEGIPQLGATINMVIDCIPAADVVEVRHGEWRFVGQNRWNDTYECSLCRKTTTDYSIYCPNCGAKMDGKGEQA